MVCLWVEWFLWARFLLECMSILFHLIGLTLFSASACFISIYFYKILMLWNTIICSSDCFAKSSILLCLHGAYCLNRVCTQQTFNLSRFKWCKHIPCDNDGLKRRDTHGLKTGLHFLHKQNKHLHVWWFFCQCVFYFNLFL